MPASPRCMARLRKFAPATDVTVRQGSGAGSGTPSEPAPGTVDRSHVLVLDFSRKLNEELLPGARWRRVGKLADVEEDGAPPPLLAIGVYADSKPSLAGEFAAWAWRVGVPALGVAVGPGATLVGPLTIPGRVGCGNCGLLRVRAAAAGRAVEAVSELASEVPLALLRRLLVAQLAVFEHPGKGAAELTDTVVRIRKGELSRHHVVPLADCAVCGGARRLGRANTPTIPAIESAATGDPLVGWVDPVTGVIPELVVDQTVEDATSLPMVVSAAPPHIVDRDGRLRRLPVGWGKGFTAAEAVRSAFGEAIERYSASLPDPARISWRRIGELDGDVLDPREFPLYSDEQYARAGFPYPRFNPELLHPWVRGRWLGCRDEVWVPAVFVFLSLALHRENLICQGSSNGLAAATTLDEASLRAILELVERDAFMSAWLSGEASQLIEIDDSLESPLREALKGIAELGGDVELRLLPTSACGTTIVALAIGDGHNWPGVTLGVATDFDPALALRGAILELCQTGPHLRKLLRSHAREIPRDPDAVREMLDHATYYFPASRRRDFDRLRAHEQVITLRSLTATSRERSLTACTAALGGASIRVAIVDVTSADVATTPLRVARAVSPDLQPISFGTGFERVPTERLQSRLRTDITPLIHPLW